MHLPSSGHMRSLDEDRQYVIISTLIDPANRRLVQPSHDPDTSKTRTTYKMFVKLIIIFLWLLI
jgi:hypothetical protein